MKRRKPRSRRSRETGREQVHELADQGAVAARGAKDEETRNAPAPVGIPSDRGDVICQSTHGVAAIGQQVDDLDDGDLSTHRPFELDIDRSRPMCARINRAFRTRGPATRAGNGDNKLLSAKVLDVPRQIRPGDGLEECGELRIDGGRARRQRLKSWGASYASLEPAPERLRNSGADGGLSLGEPPREATLAKPKTYAVRKVRTSLSTR